MVKLTQNLDAEAAAFVDADVAQERQKLADINKRIANLDAERRASEWKIAKLTGEDKVAAASIPPGSR